MTCQITAAAARSMFLFTCRAFKGFPVPVARKITRQIPYLSSTRRIATTTPPLFNRYGIVVICGIPLNQERTNPKTNLAPSPIFIPSQTNLSPPQLNDHTYHQLSNQTLDELLEYLEDLGDQFNIPGFDVTLASGVLTLKLGKQFGTYVINKQPPNLQIWMSSPISGPSRFNFDHQRECWIHSKNVEHELIGVIKSELSRILSAEKH